MLLIHLRKREKRYVRLTFLQYLPIRGIIGNYKKLLYRLTPRRFASNVKVFHSKDGRLFFKDDVLSQKDGRLLKLQKGERIYSKSAGWGLLKSMEKEKISLMLKKVWIQVVFMKKLHTFIGP